MLFAVTSTKTHDPLPSSKVQETLQVSTRPQMTIDDMSSVQDPHFSHSSERGHTTWRFIDDTVCTREIATHQRSPFRYLVDR